MVLKLSHQNVYPRGAKFREGGNQVTYAFTKNPANPGEVNLTSDPVFQNNLDYMLCEASLANISHFYKKMPITA